MLKTNRGLFKYILFSIITLGIYPLYFIHAVSVELNQSCESDGKHTSGLLAYILLSIITIGIYGIVWMCKSANRMANNYKSRKELPRITGGGYFCWSFFGSLLFGLGPLVATYKYIHSLNDVNNAYNNFR